jgi:hypothetical protein
MNQTDIVGEVRIPGITRLFIHQRLEGSEQGVALANVVPAKSKLLESRSRHVLGLLCRIPLVTHSATLNAEDST